MSDDWEQVIDRLDALAERMERLAKGEVEKRSPSYTVGQYGSIFTWDPINGTRRDGKPIDPWWQRAWWWCQDHEDLIAAVFFVLFIAAVLTWAVMAE